MNAQAALEQCGISASFGAWREDKDHSTPPDQYIVHTSMTTPDAYVDDKIVAYRTFAYVNLWSKLSPVSAIQKVRIAMTAVGWDMVEERSEYDDDANMYLVAWTWTAREEVA